MNRLNDQIPPFEAVNDVPAACFLNALARESELIQFEHNSSVTLYNIPLSGERSISIKLSHFSSLGGHEYLFPAMLNDQATDVSQPIRFSQLLALVLDEPALVGLLSKEQKAIFTQRVTESYHNTYLAAQHHPYGAKLFEQRLDFTQAEQSLLVGHSFHPAPKSREQFSFEDAKQFSPEFGGHFALVWLAVNEDVLIGDSSADSTLSQRLQALVSQDGALCHGLEGRLNDGETLLPAHPWQWQVMQELPSIQNYLQLGKIRQLGQLGAQWYPTSSTRSLYSQSLPYMLKFSLSVKLTNSIRNLSLKEVVRGTRLNDLFQHSSLQETLGDGVGFQLMQEPAFLGLVDQNGEVIDESLVALRDNPLATQPAQEAVVLATLTQQNPYGGASLLANRVSEYARTQNVDVKHAAIDWFDAYCRHTVVPLFNLQANFGVVFLAHQQNIVMQLESGFPIGMYYRDCQGTGYTDLAFELFGEQLKEAKRDVENYWDQGKVRRYFAYYLIINSSYNVISNLAAQCGVEELELVAILHKHLRRLLDTGVRDDQCLRYVLESQSLCCKGNFFCYLQNFNENSIPDPAVIYFDLPNPLVRVKETSHA
ncbi:N(2)-citryl-N(6)-acetyl-N(6)-hydroxylysine synthase [Vibrio coralliilyticus]|uniref:IucA/IucC family protein n=1 Tax=Vibrio TaxID=662 RepID=UPI000507F7B9|nr:MULTISPECIES: IucA/IucC family protein [Vibrio]KFI11826.1 N(2)-citryl-N(6)-acetyl-N(6)-hydroxylysine synthase [Vibrio sp. B183]NOI18712.1 N(2)-citryl-N(6)-acetyl-N(6)-hydroxylysine synthase [Vibrio coralliilyticus]